MADQVMPKGVTVHGSYLRLTFYIAGKRFRESTGTAPTAANIAAAGAQLRRIEKDIARGVFDYEAEFPDSKTAKKIEQEKLKDVRTFSDSVESCIKTISGQSVATVSQYKNALNNIWTPIFGADTPTSSITHRDVAEKIGSTPWSSPKLLNNYLIPLRKLFSLEYPGPSSVNNPMNGIENLKVQKKKPDPLTPAERDLVLSDMQKHYDQRVYAYFKFMFATGMRIEEAIALRWSDIDENSKVANVRRTRTFKGNEKEETKTHTERDVYLTLEAEEALRIMKPYTFMKKGDVFEHPVLEKPWHDDRSQRDTYWKPSLTRCGIRYHRQYCTRSTCATDALMRGVNPAFMAGQLGHSVKMFFDYYAKWINGASDKKQLQLLGVVSHPVQASSHG